MTIHVALIRGINVGRNKRVAMADLRALVERLGHRDARTLLNSGNVVFAAGKGKVDAARLEAALAKDLGVTARIMVLAARELRAIVTDNPLLDVARDPARLLVTVLAAPADRKKLAGLRQQAWHPEAFAVCGRAAYLWCPDGIIDSPLATAVSRALGDAGTARNWSTMTRLLAMLEPGAG